MRLLLPPSTPPRPPSSRQDQEIRIALLFLSNTGVCLLQGEKLDSFWKTKPQSNCPKTGHMT